MRRQPLISANAIYSFQVLESSSIRGNYINNIKYKKVDDMAWGPSFAKTKEDLCPYVLVYILHIYSDR